MTKVRFLEPGDSGANLSNLVSEYAADKGFPDLGDYFASLTLQQLATMNADYLIKNVPVKHKIQMRGFVESHLLPYLSSD